MIARVFARRTRACPTDELAFFDEPGLFPPEVDEAHVSVTFDDDKPKGELLAKAWERIAPVKLGGPAYQAGGDFTPGLYLKPGYVITSRGCPNKCWFCRVWRMQGPIVELPITEGWNLLDDNLLACSESHIRAVFAMLRQQKHRAEFTGGLDASLLKPWHVELLADLKPAQMFFAYDTPDDLQPLREAGRLLKETDLHSHEHTHAARCFVLIGYPTDTIEQADKRIIQAADAGFFPFAMLYHKNRKLDWRRFQRQWARPPAIAANLAAMEQGRMG